MKSVLVFIGFIVVINTKFVPKVCQKTAGIRIAKLPNTKLCNKEVSEVVDVEVEISVENHEEISEEGFLTYHILDECDVFENFFAGKRTNRGESTLSITLSDRHMIRQGLCPSGQHPIPYPHKVMHKVTMLYYLQRM